MKPTAQVVTRFVSRLQLVCAVLAVAATAAAQPGQTAPHAGFVFPAGGQQGTTFRVVVGGRSIDAVTAAVVSGPGMALTVAGVDKPLNQRQINDLRERADQLQKQPSPANRAELREIRQKVGDSVRRNRNTTIAEYVTLEITLATDAEPGPRQLRLLTPQGLTNPLVFVVGQLPEFNEPAGSQPADEPPTPAGPRAAPAPPPEDVFDVTLPVTLNGRIVPRDLGAAAGPRQQGQYQPGDVDRFRFRAKAGQDLVIAASARDLMPYLPDAVPGWFQATLALYDAGGREVAYSDDYRFQPDPVIHYKVPAEGDYVLEIKDAIYRGREDFVYRVSIGELPFVTGVFPLGGPAGSKITLEMTGWNLPVNRLETDTRRAAPGVYPISVRRGPVVSNRVPIALDTLPETLEREPAGANKDAQPVTLPVIVNGRIQDAGDWDVFSFAAQAGDTVVAEVLARRVGSPLDSVIEVTDAAGRRIAFNDDADDKGAGLVTHQADSRVTVTLPAAGNYRVRIGDRQHKGGLDYAYRLRISAPQPDFELRIAPAEINVGAGATVPITVVAVRKDGFSGDITVHLKDALPGFQLSGAMLPSGKDRLRLTLTAPAVPAAMRREPFELALEGRATIQGRQVIRRALPAEEMMQAFAYMHLVPSDALRVLVTNRGAVRVPMRIVSPQPVTVAHGRPGRIRVTMPPGLKTFENLRLELSDPPAGLSLGKVSLDRGDAEFEVLADAALVKAGERGNLIVALSGERVPQDDQKGKVARQRVQLGTLPAVAFEVVGVPPVR